MTLGNTQLDDLRWALGLEIRHEREGRGWKQSDLGRAARLAGKAAGYAAKPISDRQAEEIERGDRGQVHELWQIALALEVPLSELVRRAEARVADGGKRPRKRRAAS
jgi:transcriptional regulator with XRE-family HTH domain